MKNCPDCQAAPNARHVSNCDVARCSFTGIQQLMCEGLGTHAGDCSPTIWTGEWPGVLECQELGWYSYFVPNGRPSWVRCTPDHPGASEDLNRLRMGECVWSAERQRWVLR